MSGRTAAGRSDSKEVSAPATVPASTVSYSYPRSASLSVHRIIGSSSTIRIFSFSMASLTFCDSTFAEQLPCRKRQAEPLSQKRAANGCFPSRDRDFSAVTAKYSIQLFWFDFDGDWFTFGGLCEHEFEDAVFQGSRCFVRLDFGGQPQFAAELVRAEFGEQSLLLLLLRRRLRLAANDQ